MTETENRPYMMPNRLDEDTKLDTLSWYLLVIGLMAIAFGGLLLFLKELHYRDYVLNGVVLSRYMLLAGGGFYVSGRLLSYYRRYQRKKSGSQG